MWASPPSFTWSQTADHVAIHQLTEPPSEPQQFADSYAKSSHDAPAVVLSGEFKDGDIIVPTRVNGHLSLPKHTTRS